jgi:hypothetical protein
LKIISSFLLLIFCFLTNSCVYAPDMVSDLPDDIVLGNSLVFINGEKEVFNGKFKKLNNTTFVQCSFSKKENGYDTFFQFVVDLNNPNKKPVRARYDVDFEQIGFKGFDQINIEDSKFQLSEIDTINKILKGEIEVEFENTYSLIETDKTRYPQFIIVQCAFFENY